MTTAELAALARRRLTLIHPGSLEEETAAQDARNAIQLLVAAQELLDALGLIDNAGGVLDDLRQTLRAAEAGCSGPSTRWRRPDDSPFL